MTSPFDKAAAEYAEAYRRALARFIVEQIQLAPRAPWGSSGRVYSPVHDRFLFPPSIADRIAVLEAERERLRGLKKTA